MIKTVRKWRLGSVCMEFQSLRRNPHLRRSRMGIKTSTTEGIKGKRRLSLVDCEDACERRHTIISVTLHSISEVKSSPSRTSMPFRFIERVQWVDPSPTSVSTLLVPGPERWNHSTTTTLLRDTVSGDGPKGPHLLIPTEVSP